MFFTPISLGEFLRIWLLTGCKQKKAGIIQPNSFYF